MPHCRLGRVRIVAQTLCQRRGSKPHTCRKLLTKPMLGSSPRTSNPEPNDSSVRDFHAAHHCNGTLQLALKFAFFSRESYC